MSVITRNETRRHLREFSKQWEKTTREAADAKAVDAAYGYRGAKDNASRVANLFEQYLKQTSLLPSMRSKKRN